MAEDFRQVLREVVLDADHFVGATFSGQQRSQQVPWKKVTLRPIQLRGQYHLQFSYFDGRQDVTQNYRGEEARQELDKLLDTAFNNFHMRTTQGDIQVRITKKGKVMMHRSDECRQPPNLTHDRRKQQPLADGEPNPFLEMVGIMSADGRVKAHMQSKFRQINEFLRLVNETADLETWADDGLYMVDCGCGNAYLTFAVFYYLNEVLGIPTALTGVDVRDDLLRNHVAVSDRMGWTGLEFQVSTIIDFQPTHVPDIVLALHACDTATDEALAQAIRWGAKLIFSVPCCHHHLQQQMTTIEPFEPVLRHGILKERLGDILTDALRAQILRIAGYKTQVIEFVSTEHTAKNLMIRAVIGGNDPQAREEYEALTSLWQVKPYLETLLADVW